MIDLNFNPSRKELKWFGAGLIVFCGMVAWYVHRRHGLDLLAAGIAAAGAVAGAAGLVAPQLLRWIYVAWMIVTFPIAWTVSHLILAIVFYGVVTPIGVVLRLLGKDSMNRTFDKSAKTYWIARPQGEDTARYFRQF